MPNGAAMVVRRIFKVPRRLPTILPLRSDGPKWNHAWGIGSPVRQDATRDGDGSAMTFVIVRFDLPHMDGDGQRGWLDAASRGV
ncbi:MAG: hypothetical protein A3G35_05205 [candidate division NC10 bacterium RIFCSPLOWO2_12_FULL_66_18]|nr:MAG: hypothetical protein A3G35_05205 [candidate division NC10 bacterium RIFCSPLOWO2_12_FULL_66_18]